MLAATLASQCRVLSNRREKQTGKGTNDSRESAQHTYARENSDKVQISDERSIGDGTRGPDSRSVTVSRHL